VDGLLAGGAQEEEGALPLISGRVFGQEGGEGDFDGVMLALLVVDAGGAQDRSPPLRAFAAAGDGDGVVDRQRLLNAAVVEEFIGEVQVQGDVRRRAGDGVRGPWGAGGGRLGAGADAAGRRQG
jgi:hypothetical protein